ncbi:hypothetical protein [Paraburkholderia tagetis]|uniref:Uncharacterized protein n=1 Tax=Paraburkholderia tagetis TaxID=2913261 RepID=A0A9X1RUQ5_9BURK|nr:hypothetical protein [Paraburkholderia tagetis]MCG5074943.1 hypothetical protein [Paraburkholderia tagetis]
MTRAPVEQAKRPAKLQTKKLRYTERNLMEPVTARTFANALMAAFVIHGPILMRRIDSRAVWAALLLSLALAACGGNDSDGSAASPGTRSQQNSQQAGEMSGQQSSQLSNQMSNQLSSQQMAGASANASAEDNPPGAPDMHWAPGSGASGAH